MEDPRIISALFIFLKMAYYNVLINSHVDDDGVFGIPPRKSRHRHAAILLSEAWSVG